MCILNLGTFEPEEDLKMHRTSWLAKQVVVQSSSFVVLVNPKGGDKREKGATEEASTEKEVAHFMMKELASLHRQSRRQSL